MLAGGNKQRRNIDRKGAAPPTAMFESVLLTSTIDEEEGKDMEIIDVPSTIIQTHVEYEKYKAIFCMRGNLADILMMKAP